MLFDEIKVLVFIGIWYFNVIYFMYYMYVLIDNIYLCLYLIASYFVCCFEFINYLYLYIYVEILY